MLSRVQMLVAASAIVATATASSSAVTKLGIYDYFVDESSPVMFNGQLVMFESIVQDSPQWAGHWNASFANCMSYFRMRDQRTGSVIVNITETCNHAFGEAFVQSNDEGLDTVFIYGTTWERAQVTSAGRAKQLSWSGPCSTNNCSVDSFWSSDPNLQAWTAAGPAPFTGYLVYNNDVCHVGPPSSSSSSAIATVSDLPPHQWVMILETGGSGRFWVSNNNDPTVNASWVPLDEGNYTLDQFGNWQVGSCPSIRYDPATGYYYVLTGGYQIIILRSKTLLKGSWELGTNNGVFLNPDNNDCIIIQDPPFGGWFNISTYPDAVQHVNACLANASGPGFGNDSDVDLSEVIVSSAWLARNVAGFVITDTTPATSVVTLIQYGSGDQKSFGFSNLAVYPGPMFQMLESFFN